MGSCMIVPADSRLRSYSAGYSPVEGRHHAHRSDQQNEIRKNWNRVMKHLHLLDKVPADSSDA
jgi:hypothetical protein